MLENFCSTTVSNTSKCACKDPGYAAPPAEGTKTWGWSGSTGADTFTECSGAKVEESIVKL